MAEKVLNDAKHGLSTELKNLRTFLSAKKLFLTDCFNSIKTFLAVFHAALRDDREAMNQLLIYINRYLSDTDLRLKIYKRMIALNIGRNNFRLITCMCKILETKHQNPVTFLKSHRLILQEKKDRKNRVIIDCIDQLILKYDTEKSEGNLRNGKRKLYSYGDGSDDVKKMNKNTCDLKQVVHLLSDDEENNVTVIDLTAGKTAGVRVKSVRQNSRESRFETGIIANTSTVSGCDESKYNSADVTAKTRLNDMITESKDSGNAGKTNYDVGFTGNKYTTVDATGKSTFNDGSTERKYNSAAVSGKTDHDNAFGGSKRAKICRENNHVQHPAQLFSNNNALLNDLHTYSDSQATNVTEMVRKQSGLNGDSSIDRRTESCVSRERTVVADLKENVTCNYSKDSNKSNNYSYSKDSNKYSCVNGSGTVPAAPVKDNRATLLTALENSEDIVSLDSVSPNKLLLRKNKLQTADSVESAASSDSAETATDNSKSALKTVNKRTQPSPQQKPLSQHETGTNSSGDHPPATVKTSKKLPISEAETKEKLLMSGAKEAVFDVAVVESRLNLPESDHKASAAVDLALLLDTKTTVPNHVSNQGSNNVSNENSNNLKAKYPEFHDVKTQLKLLSDADRKKNKQFISRVFQNGYTKHSKNEKIFTTLTKLLKIKNAKRKINEEVLLDNKRYRIERQLGAGGFGVVYLATVGSKNKTLYAKAIKCQKFNCDWEFYISRSIVSRFTENINSQQEYCGSYWSDCLKNIANPNKAITFGDHSILVMNYIPTFTLLELANFMKCDVGGLRNDLAKDMVATYYTVQLLKTIEALHCVGIIHGDLKPDNCMLRCESTNPDKKPSELGYYSQEGKNGWKDRGIFLIDFGKSVDMRLFDDLNTLFVHDIANCDQQDCHEVREKKPFNYEIDYYGIAAIAHTILFGEYIETRKSNQNTHNTGERSFYEITRTLPRISRDIWPEFFDTFINSRSKSSREWPMIGTLRSFRSRFEEKLLNCNKMHTVMRDVEASMRDKN